MCPSSADTVPGAASWGSRLDARLSRHAVTGPARRDALLAITVALASAVVVPGVLWFAAAAEEVAVAGTSIAVVTLVVAGQCLLLALRRSRTYVCLGLVALVQAGLVALVPSDVVVRGPATVMAAYTVGTLLTGRSTAVAVAGAVLVEAVGAAVMTGRWGVADLTTVLAALLGAVVVYAAAALVGGYVATRRRYVALVREQAERVVLEQEMRVRAAIAGERSRMARELHDIAAHHLSGMVVQAAAVQRLVDRDPVAAREGVASIRRQGRRTLDDLRLLVRVLRDPAALEDSGPMPGLDVLDDLVREARDVGAIVDLQRRGEPRELPALVDVTLYRLAQEALSNARQHAPGAPVRVSLTYDDAAVTLSVENDPVPAGGRPAERRTDGVGLVGMRERAQLVAARLSVGPTDAGGWQVRAVLANGRDGDEEAT